MIIKLFLIIIFYYAKVHLSIFKGLRPGLYYMPEISRQEKVELDKSLGFGSILFISLASVLGSGIFFLPALGASISGPAVIIAYIILAVVFFYVALCYGELASMFPTAGGIYEFAKQAYGRFFSFIVGWIAWLVGNITTAMLTVAAINMLIPETQGIINIGPVAVPITLFKFFLSLFWILVFNYMAYRGLKTSAIMLITFATITLTVVSLIIIPTLFHFKSSNLSPIFVHSTFKDNILNLIVTVFIIAETFFGLESVLFLGGETKNPEKVIPKALMASISIIGILVILITIASLGMIPWQQYSASSTPAVDIVRESLGPTAAKFVPLAIYVVILGAAASWIVTSPRLILALAEDKLFLEPFKELHPVYGSPYKAIIFQVVASTLFLFLGSQGTGYETLLKLLIPIVLLELVIILVSVAILYKKKPDHPRPFKAPLSKYLSIVVALFFVVLIAVWMMHEDGAPRIVRLGISFIAIGIPLYFLIELYYDPKMITEISDVFAYVSLWSEKLIFTHGTKKEIMFLLGDLKGKTVMEYGCNVGTFTIDLAEAVGPMGKVHAIDLSKNHLKITQRRVDRAIWQSKELKHGKVNIIHDEYQVQRVHPSIYYADAVVSIGMLSYIQDIKKVLSDLHRVIPNNGMIVFVEFADYFKFLPNPTWLNENDNIERVFREAGFSVRVIRKKGRFWNYIYVYGIKSSENILYI